MKAIKILIKLNKNKLDKLLVDKKEEEKLEKFIIQLNTLEEEAKQEAEKYYNSEFAYMLDQYMQSFRKKKQSLENMIEKQEKKILEFQNEIFLQFSELKKLDIALKNREKALDDKQKLAEMKLLDEFTTNKNARNNKY